MSEKIDFEIEPAGEVEFLIVFDPFSEERKLLRFDGVDCWREVELGGKISVGWNDGD